MEHVLEYVENAFCSMEADVAIIVVDCAAVIQTLLLIFELNVNYLHCIPHVEHTPRVPQRLSSQCPFMLFSVEDWLVYSFSHCTWLSKLQALQCVGKILPEFSFSAINRNIYGYPLSSLTAYCNLVWLGFILVQLSCSIRNMFSKSI